MSMDHKDAVIHRLEAELKQAQQETDDILESTREIEAQLEQDVSQLEKELHEAMRKNRNLTGDVDDWKERFREAQTQHEKELSSLRDELSSVKKTHTRVRDRLRDEELKHDDLERQERIITTSYHDLETKYHELLERNAVLESEVTNTSTLEIECQRLKDEVRDLTTELAVLQKRPLQASNTETRHVAESLHGPASPLSDPDRSAHTKYTYFVNSAESENQGTSERPPSRMISSRASTRSEHPVYTTIEAMRAKLKQAREYRSTIRQPVIVSHHSTPVHAPATNMSPRQASRQPERASRPPVSLATRPATSHTLREPVNNDVSRSRRLSSGIPTPSPSRRISNPSPARSQRSISRPGSRAQDEHLSRSLLSPSPNKSSTVAGFLTPGKPIARRQSGIPSFSARKMA